MASEGRKSAGECGIRVTGGLAVGIIRYAFGKLPSLQRMEQTLTAHEGGRSHVEYDGTIAGRKTETQRVGAQHAARGSRRKHFGLRARHVQPDKSGARDFLQIVRVASAVIAVVHPDRGQPAELRFFDCNTGSAINCQIPDLVAAVDQRGRGRFVDYPYGVSLRMGFPVAGYREYERQSRDFIAAKRVVDELVQDDPGLLAGVAEMFQRAGADSS